MTFKHILAVLACLAVVVPSGLRAEPVRENLCFELVRKDDVIGTHKLRFDEVNGQTRVQILIDIAVTFGPITLYSYRHRNEEIWDKDGLLRLRTRTDDDGDRMSVSVDRSNGLLEVTTANGKSTYPAGLLPTSYWNASTHAAVRLLNTQDGRVMRVYVQPLQGGQYEISGDLNLSIDYSDSGRWSGMSFEARGAQITYRQCESELATRMAFSLDDVFTLDQQAGDPFENNTYR